jgi:hypothetical protein
MRTTLTIDDDVYEAARARAAATGRQVGDVLSEMARLALPATDQASKSPAARRSRFATFEISPGAPVIRAATIQKVLDEDGVL